MRGSRNGSEYYPIGRRPAKPTPLDSHMRSLNEGTADVGWWHETDMPKYLSDVRCWVNSGKHMLSLRFSGFDPTQTWAPPNIFHSTGPRRILLLSAWKIRSGFDALLRAV